MKKKFYLVSLCGMYDASDGDHTFYLTESKDEATKRFEEFKTDIKKAYSDDNYDEFDNSPNDYSVRSWGGGSSTDLCLVELTLNELNTYVF